MKDAIGAGTVMIAGQDGDPIAAYAAQALDNARAGGVVVIHHMPGFDEATKEITRRFATWGYAAICPNLHYREAPDAAPDDAAAAVRAAGGVPDDRLVGDVSEAVDYLRTLPTSNGKVGVIGYCSGGRQSVLAACSLPLDAAVDCYGAFVVRTPPEGSGMSATPIVDLLPELSCPLLGLFGSEDRNPSPADVCELDERLAEAGKPHDLHSFAGAGHGFFAVDRPSYRVEAAQQGWERIRDFFGRHLDVHPG
ncbi:MAG: dienelactone hydrolase family protein [Nocardioidaceae bacterium]